MKVFKKFVSYYKPYKRMFYMDMLCAIGVSAVDLAFPQILNFFTRSFFVNSPEKILGILGVLALGLLLMYCLKYACQYYITTGGILWARAWKGTCAGICLTSTNAFHLPITTRTTPAR